MVPDSKAEPWLIASKIEPTIGATLTAVVDELERALEADCEREN